MIEAIIETAETFSITLLKYKREDQQGKSPLSIYILAKTANIAVKALDMTTATTDAPSLRQIYEMGSINRSMPPTII